MCFLWGIWKFQFVSKGVTLPKVQTRAKQEVAVMSPVMTTNNHLNQALVPNRLKSRMAADTLAVNDPAMAGKIENARYLKISGLNGSGEASIYVAAKANEMKLWLWMVNTNARSINQSSALRRLTSLILT